VIRVKEVGGLTEFETDSCCDDRGILMEGEGEGLGTTLRRCSAGTLDRVRREVLTRNAGRFRWGHGLVCHRSNRVGKGLSLLITIGVCVATKRAPGEGRGAMGDGRYDSRPFWGGQVEEAVTIVS